MAGYTHFEVTEPFITSLPKLLANDNAALTWNAGTSFPTNGLSIGMPCYRTDEKKLYVYDGAAWSLMMDYNDKPLKTSESDGKYVAYAVEQSLSDEQKAQARTNISAPSQEEFDAHTHTKSEITDLADVVGATGDSAGVQGLVPQPPSGGTQMTLFGDGSWANAKVNATEASDNAEHPLLMRSVTSTSAGAEEAIVVPGITVNPSTKVVSASGFSGKVAWTDITDVPTNVKNAVSFVEGQTLTAEQAQIVRLKILTAYQTSNTGSLILPNGTIAQRDTSPVAGAIRFNSEKGWFEGYTGSQWVALVSDPAGKNLPTGTCLCGLFKEAPDLFLSLDGSRIEKSDYYDLCNLLWQFNSFKGDGKTYATLPNMHHRFFEGTTTISEVATYVEAGLPNITGYINPHGAGSTPPYTTIMTVGGAFWAPTCDGYAYVGRNTSSISAGSIEFNANRANGYFGRASCFQPESLRSLVVVRT